MYNKLREKEKKIKTTSAPTITFYRHSNIIAAKENREEKMQNVKIKQLNVNFDYVFSH